MKIGIVTIYDAYNYGSFLQAFALQEFLSNKGHEVYILDFSKSLKSRIARKYLAKSIKRTILKLKRYFVYRKDWKSLNIKRGNIVGSLDLIIIGSDEVWNIDNESIEHIKQFYGIGCAAKQIIAYAPSLGYATSESYKFYPEFIEGLKEKISFFYMRDAFTEEFVKETIGKETRKVSDPTVLLCDRWKEYMQDCPIGAEKYMIYYSYLDDTPFKEYIKRFAKENNLILIVVGFNYDWCDDQIIVTPFQFLSVIGNAQCVVTSTYHGTVFSTLLKKKFVVIHPSIKVIDYLEQIGLEKKCSLEDGYEYFSQLLVDDIDYNLVGKKLNKLKEISVQYINSNLNE